MFSINKRNPESGENNKKSISYKRSQSDEKKSRGENENEGRRKMKKQYLKIFLTQKT